MVTDLDKQAIDLLGLKNANVVADMVERWIFPDYLQGEDAFLALCVGKSGEDGTYVSNWHNDSNDLSDYDLLMDIALSAFADLPKAYKVKEREIPTMLCSLNVGDLGIDCKSFKIELSALWLEKLSIYSFAVCNDNFPSDTIKASLFELNYTLCRALAPKSNIAWALIDSGLPYMKLERKDSPWFEEGLIQHVERAFCCSIFPSIKAWKK